MANNPTTLTDPSGLNYWEAVSLFLSIQAYIAMHSSDSSHPTPPRPRGQTTTDPAAPTPIPTPKPKPPHFEYKQNTGDTDVKVGATEIAHVGTGYAGHGEGLKNPANQSVSEKEDKENAGPLPQGQYSIGPMFDNKGSTGPASMRLTPDPNNEMFGRDRFLIHGPVPGETCPCSSEGCIVLPRAERVTIGVSGIDTLEVVQ